MRKKYSPFIIVGFFFALLAIVCPGLFQSNHYAHADITSNLVGRWTFDTSVTNWTASTTSDVSGNNNTGALTSFYSSTSTVSGKYNEALDFGHNEYVEVTDPVAGTLDFSSTSDFTLSAWVKARTYKTEYFLQKDEYTSTAQGYKLALLNGGSVQVSVDDGPHSLIYNTGVSIGATGAWHHIVFVWDDDSNTNTAVYVDGALVKTAAAGGVDVNTIGDMSNTRNLYIGARKTGAGMVSAFDGDIDEVRIYSRALSSQDITDLYNAGMPVLSLQPAFNLSQTSATLGAVISSDGGISSTTVRGFAYSTDNRFVTNVSTTSSSGTFGLGAFSDSISGLTCNTVYHVRGYATNSAGTSFTSSVASSSVLTTLPCNTTPTVITGYPTDINPTTAKFRANISATGGASITQSGFVYGTSASFTSGVIATTTLGSAAVGVFTQAITGLTQNTNYYVRAYATNSSGTVYGVTQDFITSRSSTSVNNYDVLVRASSPLIYLKAQETSGTTIRDCSTSDACTGGVNATVSGNGVSLGAGSSLIPSESSDVSIDFTNPGSNGTFSTAAATYSEPSFDATHGVTIEFAIKFDSYPVSPRYFAISTNTLSAGSGGWRVSIPSDGTLSLSVGAAASLPSISFSGCVVPLNKRTFVAVSFNNSSATAYVNDRKCTVTISSAPLSAAGDRVVSSTTYFDGQLSHVAIYNSLLSVDDVMTHYRASRGIEAYTKEFYTAGYATSSEAKGTLSDPMPFRNVIKANALVRPGGTIWMIGHSSQPALAQFATGDYRSEPRNITGEDPATAGTGLGAFEVDLQGTSDNPIDIRVVPGQLVRWVSYDPNLLINSPTSAGSVKVSDTSQYVNVVAPKTANSSGFMSGLEITDFSTARRAVTPGSDPGTINVGKLTNGSAVFIDTDSNGNPTNETNFNYEHVGKSFNLYWSATSESNRSPDWSSTIASANGTTTVTLSSAWASTTLQLGCGSSCGAASGYPRVRIEGNLSSPGADVGGRGVADPIAVFGDYINFINPIIHDASDGYAWWSQSEGGTFHGAVIWGNGWIGYDRGHGHGIYTQNLNTSPVKNISNIVSFDNFETGMKAFAVNQNVSHYLFENISSYENGRPSTEMFGSSFRSFNLLIGADDDQPSDDITVRNSRFYCNADNIADMSCPLQVGLYSHTSGSATVSGNHITSGDAVFQGIGFNSFTFTDNLIWHSSTGSYANIISFVAPQTSEGNAATSLGYSTVTSNKNSYFNNGTSAKYFKWSGAVVTSYYFDAIGDFGTSPDWRSTTGFEADSTYTLDSPNTNFITIVPNKYELGSANITVENYSNSASVTVDLSSVGLVSGQTFQIRDAENLFGNPLYSGTYGTGGGQVTQATIAMSGRTKTQPLGITGLTTSSKFAVFEVIPVPLSESSISAPTVTTADASSITKTSAGLNGLIVATGGEDSTQDGFAYSTVSDLSSGVSTTTLGSISGASSFVGTVSDLTCNTTYYFRAYAGNSVGTGLGAIANFTTSSCSSNDSNSNQGSSQSQLTGGFVLPWYIGPTPISTSTPKYSDQIYTEQHYKTEPKKADRIPTSRSIVAKGSVATSSFVIVDEKGSKTKQLHASTTLPSEGQVYTTDDLERKTQNNDHLIVPKKKSWWSIIWTWIKQVLEAL